MNVKKMDTIYEIRNNYLFLKMTGNFDLNRSKEIIYDTSEKLRIHSLKNFFWDITEVKGLDERQKFVYTLYELSSVISDSFPPGTKISLLETKEQFVGQSFFEVVMNNRGFLTKVTTKPEECLKWLGVSSEEKL